MDNIFLDEDIEMDKKEFLKSPSFLITVIGIALLILYFIMSPYQNCKRDTNFSASQCIVRTSWLL